MGWQVTAKTIHCDLVRDYTTLMVYKDGSTRCTYYSKNSSAKDGKKRLKNCTGPNCDYVTEFSAWASSH